MTQQRQQDLVQMTLTRLQESLQLQLRALTRDVTSDAVHQSRIAIRRLRAALRV